MADTDFNAQVRETILHLLAEATVYLSCSWDQACRAAIWELKTGMLAQMGM